MAEGKITIDHDEIRQWAEARGVRPAPAASAGETPARGYGIIGTMMRFMTNAGLTLAIAVVCAGGGPAVAADAEAGKAVFNRCKICHAVEAGKPSAVGPNLHGVFGRKAGTFGDFAYSEAMKSSGIVWDDDTLAKYLRSPRDVVPGGKMAFPGIKNDNEMADLLAYLHQATQ